MISAHQLNALALSITHWHRLKHTHSVLLQIGCECNYPAANCPCESVAARVITIHFNLSDQLFPLLNN